MPRPASSSARAPAIRMAAERCSSSRSARPGGSCASAPACRPPAPLRRLLGWYYARIYIHVRPERVYVWPRGEIDREPRLFDAHMEEVRSGHSEEPERFHAAPHGGASAWHHGPMRHLCSNTIDQVPRSAIPLLQGHATEMAAGRQGFLVQETYFDPFHLKCLGQELGMFSQCAGGRR